MQQLFANIANVANTFAQIIAGRSRKLGANLLHIADDRRPQSLMLFCHQATDIACKFIILNQRQMGAEDSFTFAVTLTQLLVQLLGKRCQAVLQPDGILRTGGDCPITVEAVAL